MKRKQGLAAALLFLPILASSQMPDAGSLQVRIVPNRSTYAVENIHSAPDSFLVTVTSEATGGQCALAAGYSGPYHHIHAAQAGRCTIRFGSAGTFRADMGDRREGGHRPSLPVLPAETDFPGSGVSGNLG